MTMNRDNLNVARAKSLTAAAEACAQASIAIGKMAMSKDEREFQDAILAASKELASSLVALQDCLNDTRKFLSENPMSGIDSAENKQ